MSHAKDEILTPLEASRILKIAPRTLSRYRVEGRISFYRFSARKIAYRKTDVEEFVNQTYVSESDSCL